MLRVPPSVSRPTEKNLKCKISIDFDFGGGECAYEKEQRRSTDCFIVLLQVRACSQRTWKQGLEAQRELTTRLGKRWTYV